MGDKCKALAKLHSDAVDYQKTQISVKIPKYLIPTKYPNFMQKLENKPNYQSDKIFSRFGSWF